MDTSIILHQMVQLFIVIALGYLLRKIGLINDEFNKKMTSILLNVTLPATILASVCTQDSREDLSTVGIAFGAAVILFAVQILFGFAFSFVARIPRETRGMYTFMMSFANVGFMGIPIATAVMGDIGTLYAAIFNIIFNIVAYTAGVMIINMNPVESGDEIVERIGTALDEGESDQMPDKKRIIPRKERVIVMLKSILTPGVLLSVLAIVIYIFNIALPDDIVNTLSSVGGITTPMAMLLIGGSLAKVKVKDVFTDSVTYIFVLAKHFGLPVLVMPLMHLFIKDQNIIEVYFCLMLMPVANMAMLFATEYGRDETLPARVIFISTLASLATVPLMLSLML